MSKILVDYKNQDIINGDIVKRKNMITNEENFYKYVSVTDIKGTLYLLDGNNEVAADNKKNINIDNGISLNSNSTFRWSKVY